MALNRLYERVRAAEDALRGPFCFLERRHGLAEIVERSAGVLIERPRVNAPGLCVGTYVRLRRYLRRSWRP